MLRPIRILGIDPGLRRTGWGMIAIDGNRLRFLACGSLATDNGTPLSDLLPLAEHVLLVVRGHDQRICRPGVTDLRREDRRASAVADAVTLDCGRT